MKYELVPIPAEKEPLGLWGSAKLGTRKAGIGAIQLGLDVAKELGYDYPETRAASAKVAGTLREQGKGSGLTGAVGEILGNPLTLPLAAVALPSTLMGMAGLGAVEGAAFGATEALPEGEPRGRNTAISAAVGGVAAPATSIALKGIGRGADVMVNKVSDAYSAGKSLVNSFLNQADDASRQTMAVEISGITSPQDAIKAIDSMGDDAVKYVRNAIKSGLSPQEAYIAGKAQAKGIELTRGQLSQSPVAQRLEDMAQQGVLGDDASKIATTAATKQQAAMRSYADDIAARATNAPSGTVALDNTSVGGTIKSEILPLAERLKGAAKEAYGVDTSAKVAIDSLADIPKTARRELVAQGFDVGGMPVLNKRLGEMNRAAELFSRRVGKKQVSLLSEKTPSFAVTKLEKAGAKQKASFISDYLTYNNINHRLEWNRGKTSAYIYLDDGIKIRLSDHGNVSSLNEFPDYNIAPQADLNVDLSTGMLRGNDIGVDSLDDVVKSLANKYNLKYTGTLPRLTKEVRDKISFDKSARSLIEIPKAYGKDPLEHISDILKDAEKYPAAYRDSLPKYKRALEILKEESRGSYSGGAIKYQAAEVFKKRLYKSYQDAQGAEKAALGKLHSAYAERLDKIIDDDMLINPDEAAKTLRQAPGLWRKYRQTIYGTDGKAALGKIVEKDLSDKQVSDLLGSGLFGKGETQKVVKHLKFALGDDSDSMNQVRGLYLNRIMNNALQDPKKPLSEAIYTNLSKFKRENGALYNELYSPMLRKEIEDFAAIAWQAGNKVKSKVNPSGSGVYAAGFVNGLLRKLPGIGEFSGEIIRQLNQGGMERTAVQSIVNPLKAIGADTRIVSNALKAAGFSAGAQLGRLEKATPQAAPAQQNQRFELVPVERPQQPITPQSSLTPTQQNEGFRGVTYRDTEGNPTIGYGFNFNSGIANKVWKQAGLPMEAFAAVKAGKMSITPEHGQSLYRAAEKVATDDAVSYYGDGFYDLTPQQQTALVDMSYQMGGERLAKFRDLKRHLRTKNAHGIVQSIKRSKYAQQTPERAGQIAQLLIQFNRQ